MLEHAVLAALGAVLACSGAVKLRAPVAAAPAFATFGVRLGPAAPGAVVALALVETAIGVAAGVGFPAALVAAAALTAAFAFALGWAVRRGRTGDACGCFGARSTVSVLSVVRAAALSVAFAAAAALVVADAGPLAWTQALAVAALLAAAAAGLAAMGLAREVAALRLSQPPAMPLVIDGEGPGVGSVHPELVGEGGLRVALFTSPGCRLCHALRPALAELARDDDLDVSVFDEHDHAGAWRALGIPGSPFAVVATPSGRVLGAGTFNSLGQLDALILSSRAAGAAT